jgi:hypothetical protein
MRALSIECGSGASIYIYEGEVVDRVVDRISDQVNG